MEVLERFYERLAKSDKLEGLDIPPSSVFYVRRAIESATGLCYDLEHVEVSLFLEGLINPDKHFLGGIPQWYTDKYLGGVKPDMEELRNRLRTEFKLNQQFEKLALYLRSLCYPVDPEKVIL